MLLTSTYKLFPFVISASRDTAGYIFLFHLMFLPGKSRREISREIWGFESSRFAGNLDRDSWNFFYISRGFGGTDICHSDIKNALLEI